MIEFPREIWNTLQMDFNLRSDYSGRAMYGDRCVALVGTMETYTSFIVTIIENVVGVDDEVEHCIDFLNELGRRVRQDQMGDEMVFYFPGVKLESE